MLDITLPIKNAYYIGDKYAKNLENLNIYTIGDLLYHYPIKYTDSRNLVNIYELDQDNIQIIRGQILSINTIYTRNRKIITKAVIEDNTGYAEIIWFNQKYLENTIKNNTVIIVGKCKLQNNGVFLFQSPQFEVVKNNTDTTHFLKITPIYNQTRGISSKWIRSRIKNLLLNTKIEDPIPNDIKIKYDLLDKKVALEKLHFPTDFNDIKKAKKRLGFDEILYIQILSHLKKEERRKRASYKVVLNQEKINQFIKDLPFKLTQSQIKCINEIYSDIKKDIPMNRLIEGDVGSGKTIVAIIIAYTLSLEDIQTAVMVPTLILAKQHYDSFTNYLNKYGIEVQLITTNTKGINTHANIFIGTHALLFKKGFLNNVGLVIIDEQHRFGVTQRELLIENKKLPHILTMSATPIPRTLALGIYGELDISLITEKPENRNTRKKVRLIHLYKGKIK
jgi:ATP-dependent DNA helicase RecG